MYPIYYDTLFKLIQDLSNKIDKLNDKVDYHTNIILNLIKEHIIFKETINNSKMQINNSINNDKITDTLKDIEKNKDITYNIIFIKSNIF